MQYRLLNIFMAMIFITFGVLLILKNLNIGEIGTSGISNYLFPILFIVVGLTLVIVYFFGQTSGWMFGSFLLIYGILLLLGEIPFVDFEFTFSDIYKLWPLLIIYFGFSLIGFGRRRKIRKRYKPFKSQTYTGGYCQSFTIGDQNYSEPNWEVKPIYINRAIGDYYFDFTKAFIPEKKTPITVECWAGDIRFVLPDHLAFRLEAYVMMGEINFLGQISDGINRSISYQTSDYKNATKKLDIHLYVKAGTIRVDRI